MPEPHKLPESVRAEALARLNAEKAGIRANAMKQGYAARDKEWHAKLGVSSIDEALQINRLIAERDARVTKDEERKHGRHQRWLGIGIGVPIGMVLACLAILAMQGVIWDTATRSFREQAMTGAIISSQDRERGDTPPSFTERTP